jgi:hypothetical protein
MEKALQNVKPPSIKILQNYSLKIKSGGDERKENGREK